MSKVAIQGNASGTGVFTIASPNSNTDRTLTLPDSAGTMMLTDTGVTTAQMPAGSVLQSIRTYIADAEIIVASTSFVEASTACRVAITPKRTGSLIYVDMNCSMVQGGYVSSYLRSKMYVKVGAGSFGAMPTYNGYTPGNYQVGYSDTGIVYAPFAFGGVYEHSSTSDELIFSPFASTNGSNGRFMYPASSYSITVTEVAQ